VLLHCRTRPIVETSRAVAFGCYAQGYAGLAAQLAAVKLSPLHNFWSAVFDFSPAEGNWGLLPEERAASLDALTRGRVPPEVAALLAGAAGGDAALLPTWGDRPCEVGGRLLALLPAAAGVDGARALAATAAATGARLLRANVAAVGADLAQQMGESSGWSAAEVAAAAGERIGLEFAGSAAACGAIAAAAAAAGGLACAGEDAASTFRFLGIDG
jgi:protein XRP2